MVAAVAAGAVAKVATGWSAVMLDEVAAEVSVVAAVVVAAVAAGAAAEVATG